MITNIKKSKQAISRKTYSQLIKLLENAGFERCYTVMAGENSGSLFINKTTKKEFIWTPQTTKDDILDLIN